MEQRDTCFSASPLAWKWILEKLVGNKNVGKPILKGLSGYVKDIEEPHCRPLLRRLALRYLEESIANDRLDSSIIPLVKAASEVDTPDSRLLVSQRSPDKKLLIRVKTEAVISWIRKESDGEVVDWDAFAQTLSEAFPPDDLDPETCTQREELLAALASKDEKVVARHPIQRLKEDLLHFIKQNKASMEQPMLDQIAHSYFDESLQKRSYIVAEPQNGSDGGDVHVKQRTRCQAPVSDILNHAKVGMPEMEAGLALTTEEQPIAGKSVLPKLLHNETCVESREDYVDLQDKSRELQSQVRQSNGPIATRDGQSSQLDEGTNTCNLRNLSAHGDAGTQRDGRKRRMEFVGMSCVDSGRKAIPGLRRKALAWTPQEEEALKDGVMKYSQDGGRWGFQWQRILESGYGVFDPSRTGVDLKDKWRNVQRRASPT